MNNTGKAITSYPKPILFSMAKAVTVMLLGKALKKELFHLLMKSFSDFYSEFKTNPLEIRLPLKFSSNGSRTGLE